MRKKSLRFISAALAVSMMLSALPVGAFAAEPGAAEPENGASAQAVTGTVLDKDQPNSIKTAGTYILKGGNYSYSYTDDDGDDVTEDGSGVNISAAGQDVTIEITGDLTWFGGITVDNVGTLTINNNGHTVSSDCRAFLSTSATSGAPKYTISVNGGTYTTDAESTYLLGMFALENPNATVYLNNITYSGKPSAVYNKGIAEITGGNYCGSANSWINNYRATIYCANRTTLTNATVSQTDGCSAVLVTNGATVTIEGGTYSATSGEGTLHSDDLATLYNADGHLEVNNATVSGTGNKGAVLNESVHIWESHTETKPVTIITGGIYTGSNISYSKFGDSFSGVLGNIGTDTTTTMTVNNATVTGTDCDAIDNFCGTLTINGGTYSSSKESAVYNKFGYDKSILYINGGTFTGTEGGHAIFNSRKMYINGGIFKVSDEGSKSTICNEDELYIDQGNGKVTEISNPNADANAIENIGMLFLKGGSVTAPKGNAILDGVASMEITGGTITGKNGIKLKEWSSSLTEGQNLKHTIKAGTISGDEADIYLGKNRQINIAEEYNAPLTVLTEDPSHGRQVTAKTNGTNYQNNLNLISKNENYRIGYQKNDADKEYRYLIAQHTVKAVDAEAKVGEQEVTSTDLVDADTTVTVTTTVPKGQRFTGWTVKVGDEEKEADNFLTQDENDPTKATFTMPDADVEVTANFKGIPTLNIGDHVTANIEGNDASVPSGSAVLENTTVHLTATVPEGQRFTGWTVTVGGEKQEADFLTEDANDPTKATFTMPDKNVEVTANFEGIPKLNIGDYVTANMEGSAASVPSGSAVPVGETVHLTAIAPEGQHFISWTVMVGGEEKEADTFLKTPDKNDPTKATFTMPDKDVEVKANFEKNTIEPIDPIGPSDTDYGGDIAAGVVIGGIAAVGAYEVGTGLYRILAMDDVAMPTNRIALAKLLWERAGKPEPESTALYSDISAEDTDAQKAARWAVEQGLMKDDTDQDDQKFHPAFPVSKLRVCLTWEKAKQKGLFDKTEA